MTNWNRHGFCPSYWILLKYMVRRSRRCIVPAAAIALLAFEG
jgi:hypothetical protein